MSRPASPWEPLGAITASVLASLSFFRTERIADRVMASFDRPRITTKATKDLGRRAGLSRRARSINFLRIAADATARSEAILARWLPDGRREAGEWVAKNPRRADKRPGSFKVNLRSGRWGDFASGDKGGDLISLGAYLFGLPQDEAARRVADMLGVSPYDD